MVYEATNRGYKKAAIFFGDDESAQSIRGVAVPSCKAAGIEIVRDITGSARELLERGGDEALGV